ncbi:unnamed protein product [Effrenium voratum]|nr:unnamed protein product [Effrenium voratum]
MVLDRPVSRDRWLRSLALAIRLRQSNVQVDVFLHSSCCRPGGWQQGLELLRGLGLGSVQSDVTCYNSAAHSCTKGSVWPKSLVALSDLKTSNLQVDIVSCNVAMTAGLAGQHWRRSLETRKELWWLDMSSVTQKLVLQSGWQRATSLFEELQIRGLEVHALAGNLLLNLLPDWRGTLLMLAKFRAVRLADIASYSSAMKACERAQLWPWVLHLFLEARRRSLETNVVWQNSAISAFVRCARWRGALEFFDAMQMDGLQADLITYSAATVAAGAGHWALALQVWASMKRLQTDLVATSAAVSACESCWQQATGLLEELKQMYIEVNVVAANAAMTANKAAGEWRLTLQGLASLTASSQADSATFHVAMGAWRGVKAWQEALMCAATLRRQSLKVDAITGGSAITACSEGSQWQGALHTLFDFCTGVSIVACNAAISACQQEALWATALWLLNSVEARSLQANIVSYNSAMNSCERGGRWQLAVALFADLRLKQVELDINTWNAVICACRSAGLWQAALELLFSVGLQRDVVTFNSAASVCEQSSQWQASLCVFEALCDACFKPDAVSYSVAINACEQGEQWQYALGLLQIAHVPASSGVILHNSAVNVCSSSSQWQRALLLVQHLVASKLQTNLYTYSAAISACEKGRQWQLALYFLEDLARRRLERDVVTHTAAISACEKAGRWQHVLRLFSEQRARDVICYSTAINASIIGMLHRTTPRLLTELHEFVMQVWQEA